MNGHAAALTRVAVARRRGPSAALVALTAYAFVVISRISDDFPSLHLALVAALVTVVATFSNRRPGPTSVWKLAESRVVLALFGLAVITVPFSVWPGESFAFVTGHSVKVTLVFLAVLHLVRSTRDVRLLAWAVPSAMLCLVIGLVLAGEGARPQITNTYDANDIALVMVTGFPLALTIALRGRGPGRYLAGLIAALAVVAVVWTQSRAGFVGFCVVAGLVVLRMPRRQRMVVCVLLLATVLIFSAVGSSEYWQRMATIWEGQGAAGATVSSYDASGLWGARWGVWQTGFSLMLDRALLGVGAGVYEIAEGLSHGGRGKWSAAHNSFLQIGAELGLVGLGLFVLLLCYAVRNCRRVVRLAARHPQLHEAEWLARTIEVSLYGYIAVALSLSQAYSYLLYLLLALSVVLARLAADGARDPSGVAARSRGGMTRARSHGEAISP